jgi:CyaY protein
MTESEFLQHADRVFEAIERSVDAAGADIEVSRAGSVLTLELDDGSKVIVNSQSPMQQIWVAARAGAYHYVYADGAWRDTRDGSELFAALSRLLSAQGAGPLVLRSDAR